MTETWDETKPAGSRNPKLGDDDIREFKRALRERLAEDHQFEATESPAFGDTGYKIGKHNYVTLIEQSSDKTTLENEIAIVAKDDGSNPEIFLIPESAGTAIKLTQSNVSKFADNLLSGVNLNTTGEANRPVIFTGIGINTDTSYKIDFPTNNLDTTSMKFLTGDESTIMYFYQNVAPPGWKVLTSGAGLVLGVASTTYTSSGTTTSQNTNKLIDGGATFQTDGVKVGMPVYNTTDNTDSYVTAVDSETQLSINDDIFTTSEGYRVGGLCADGGDDVGSWSGIVGFTKDAHTHIVANHNHQIYGAAAAANQNDQMYDSGGNQQTPTNSGYDKDPGNYSLIMDQGGQGILSQYSSNSGPGNTGAQSDDGITYDGGWRPRAAVGKLCQFDTA